MNNKWFQVVLVTMLVLAFIRVPSVRTQPAEEVETFFSKDYFGITIVINATCETVPGDNMTVNIWVNCTWVNVHIDYVNLTVWGLSGGNSKTSLNTASPLADIDMSQNEIHESTYYVQIPDDVWGVTVGELDLKYTMSEESRVYDPGFSMTIVRNVDFERLKEEYANLDQSYHELNDSFSLLNNTNWELQQNLTSLSGAMVDLENTRRVVAILVVISVFFVVTTMYLMLRRPRVYV